MDQNIGDKDKYIRVGIGMVIIALYSQQIIKDGIGYIGLGIALSVLITALVRKSPLYEILGIDTSEKKDE